MSWRWQWKKQPAVNPQVEALKLSARLAQLERENRILTRELHLIATMVDDMYKQSLYLGGLKDAIIWVKSEPDGAQERYLSIVSEFAEIKQSLASFSDAVSTPAAEKRDVTKWRV